MHWLITSKPVSNETGFEGKPLFFYFRSEYLATCFAKKTTTNPAAKYGRHTKIAKAFAQ